MMGATVEFRESSTIISPLNYPTKWGVWNLDRTNYPEIKFNTSLTEPKLRGNTSTNIGLERKDILDELKEIYEFSNIKEIRNFIMQNYDLVDILKEAPEHIYRIFGKDIKLILELHSDPEEDWDELFIVIKSSYSPQEAVEHERKLFNDWFVYIMDKLDNKLNFTEEPL